MQVALILLLVAKRPGSNLRDLVRATGTGKSSVSRNVARLSSEHGDGLVTYSEDPLDRRNKTVKLTPKGALIVQAITACTSGHEDVT